MFFKQNLDFDKFFTYSYNFYQIYFILNYQTSLTDEKIEYLGNKKYQLINPFPHCTFDVAHLTAELQISPPPQKDDIMQNKDNSDDVTGADL